MNTRHVVDQLGAGDKLELDNYDDKTARALEAEIEARGLVLVDGVVGEVALCGRCDGEGVDEGKACRACDGHSLVVDFGRGKIAFSG